MKSGHWPFKHLKQTSSWPMQPLVLQLAATVLQAPSPMRKETAGKVVERCVRMGARLAVEFGVSAPVFVDIAKAVMIKEGGSEAQTALATAAAAVTYEATLSPEDQAMVDRIFSKADLPPGCGSDDDPPEA